MSDDLVQFLRARLNDDEAYARNAFGDHNDAGPDWHEQWSGSLNIGDAEDLVLTNDSAVSRFMARHDPARVLREVEAGRQLITTCEAAMRNAALPHPEHVPGVYPPAVFVDGYAAGLEYSLRLRAASYAAHPDYRAEWRAGEDTA